MAEDMRTQPLPGTFPVGGSGVDPEKEALRKLLAEQQSQGVEAGSAQQQEQTGAYTSPEIPAFFDQFSELTNASQTDTNAPQLAAYVDPVTGRIGYRYNYGATPGVVTTGATVVTPGRLGRTDIPSQDEISEEVGPESPQEGTRPVVGTDPATVTARGGDVITGAGQDVPEAQGFVPNEQGIPIKGGLDPYGLDPTNAPSTFGQFIENLANSPIGTALKGFMAGGPVGAIAGAAMEFGKTARSDLQEATVGKVDSGGDIFSPRGGIGGDLTDGKQVEAPQPEGPQKAFVEPQDPSRVDLSKGAPTQPVTTGPDRSVEVGPSYSQTQDRAQFDAASSTSLVPPPDLTTRLGTPAEAAMLADLATEMDQGAASRASDVQQFDTSSRESINLPTDTQRGGFGASTAGTANIADPNVEAAEAEADFEYSGFDTTGVGFDQPSLF